MGSSSQSSSSTTVGPGKAALAQHGPQRIEDAYQSDMANPNRLAPQAQSYLGGVLRGDYLDPTTNPSYGALVKSISDPITASTSAMFGRAGRGTSASSSGLGGALATGLSAGLAQPLFNAFQQERGLQQQATGMAGAVDSIQSLPLEQYLERARGLASMDSKNKTTTSQSPFQTIAGLGLTAAGMFGNQGFGPYLFGKA